MIYALRALTALLLLSQIVSCSRTPAVRQPPDWRHEKAAIRLHLVGDQHLNLYQKKSHSLIVCLYQLRDSAGFDQLINDKDGLPKLLECNRFDPSVSAARRFIVQPGQELTEELDRAEGTRFVGIVAGYYTLHKERSARLIAVPVTERGHGSNAVQKGAKLEIDLDLGQHQIKTPAKRGGTPSPPHAKER